MKKLYYLSTCDTCKGLMKSWDLPSILEQQDIKSQPITESELDSLQALAGSYEALFNRRARLYKEKGLAGKELNELDIKALILEHYTFLKRPILIWEDQIFIGNAKKTVAEVAHFLKQGV
ncbi:MAG: hypothetical protein NXI09_11170 [Bacteroidetes bacterium]|nr:hypothetical protein [Bacteroidota bacterium]